MNASSDKEVKPHRFLVNPGALRHFLRKMSYVDSIAPRTRQQIQCEVVQKWLDTYFYKYLIRNIDEAFFRRVNVLYSEKHGGFFSAYSGQYDEHGNALFMHESVSEYERYGNPELWEFNRDYGCGAEVVYAGQVIPTVHLSDYLIVTYVTAARSMQEEIKVLVTEMLNRVLRWDRNAAKRKVIPLPKWRVLEEKHTEAAKMDEFFKGTPYRMRLLTTKEAYQAEGTNGGHCVAGYWKYSWEARVANDVESTPINYRNIVSGVLTPSCAYTQVYSLRYGDEVRPRSTVTILFEDMNPPFLHESLAAFNRKPLREDQTLVEAWFEHYRGQFSLLMQEGAREVLMRERAKMATNQEQVA